MSMIQDKKWIPKRVAIIGAARSGLAAASFLRDRGVSVLLSDSMPQEKLASVIKTAGLDGIEFEGGGNSDKVLEAALIICSPGVPSNIPVLSRALAKGIPVWAEIELAWRQSVAPYLALTGSTGKSTTVSLIGSAVAASGRAGVVAGNIGLPLIATAPAIPQSGFITAEISSFQLENIELFRPRVACVLNLMKNHLDRYENEDGYYNAKKLMMKNMAADDVVVFNANDERLCVWADEFASKLRVIMFGAKHERFESVWIEGDEISTNIDKCERVLFLSSDMKIAGRHNAENACAAAAVSIAAGIDDVSVANGITSFTGLPHRLEFVRELDGVGYYNDSKATTAESIDCALKAFTAGVHLIAGGRDKGCDFAGISESVKRHAASVILIGEATDRIELLWKGLTEIHRAASLEEAVSIAKKSASRGQSVVMSPGCSSFDMFKSYEHRGEVFRDAVRKLA